MGQLADSEAPVISCNALLVKSLRIYEQINEIYVAMAIELSIASTCKAQETMETVNALLQDAQIVDCLIVDHVKNFASYPHSIAELLDKREVLLAGLRQANQQIASKVENVKSLLQHEIGTMAKNRCAMKGYRQVDTERKSIIKNFF